MKQKRLLYTKDQLEKSVKVSCCPAKEKCLKNTKIFKRGHICLKNDWQL